MNLTVLGCGRWGTFLAGYHCARNDVMLWGRPGSRSMMTLQTERKNEYMILPDKLRLETDLGRALNFAEMVIISISAQQLRLSGRAAADLSSCGKNLYSLHEGN